LPQASDLPSSPLPARQAGPVGGWPLMLSGAVAGAALQLQQPVLWPAGAYAVLALLAGVLAWGAWRARRGALRLRGAAMACAAALAVFALTGLRARPLAAGAPNP